MTVILCNIIAKRCHHRATSEQSLLGCEDLDVHVTIFTNVPCLHFPYMVYLLKHNIAKEKNSPSFNNSLC